MSDLSLSLAVAFAVLGVVGIIAQDKAGTIASVMARSDFALTADPGSVQWNSIPGVFAERGPKGEEVPGHRTEIRSRWTGKNLYLLFVCPYEQLYLKPDTSTTTETDRLWEWDVAEAFIGTDFQDIKQYTEFQVSPNGEWVDLHINRNPSPPVHDVGWNSGFEVKARIDAARKVWCGEMRIPMEKVDRRTPEPGLEMRINFYRMQGPPPSRKGIAWQPTGADNYHVPEAFGRLRLVE